MRGTPRPLSSNLSASVQSQKVVVAVKWSIVAEVGTFVSGPGREAGSGAVCESINSVVPSNSEDLVS